MRQARADRFSSPITPLPGEKCWLVEAPCRARLRVGRGSVRAALGASSSAQAELRPTAEVDAYGCMPPPPDRAILDSESISTLLVNPGNPNCCPNEAARNCKP